MGRVIFKVRYINVDIFYYKFYMVSSKIKGYDGVIYIFSCNVNIWEINWFLFDVVIGVIIEMEWLLYVNYNILFLI